MTKYIYVISLFDYLLVLLLDCIKLRLILFS